MKTNLLVFLFFIFSHNFYSQNLFLFEQDGKFGFRNDSEKTMISPTYQAVRDFTEGLAAVELNNRWGFIDTTGKVVFPFVYLNAESFNNGIAIIETEKGEQFLSRSGVIYDRDPQLVSNNPVIWSVSILKNKKYKYGLIDVSGKEILPPLFDQIDNENSQIQVYVENRKAEFNLKNDEIKQVLYEIKNSKKKYGFQDLFGKVIIKPKYEQILEVWPTFAIVTLKRKQVLVRFKDKNEFSFDQIDHTLSDYIPSKLTVSLNGKKGMIDTTGKVVIPILYDDLFESSFDRYQLYGVVVNLNEKYGLVDRNGKEITPIIYDQISFDFDGHEISKYALVQKNGKWGCVDNKTGNALISMKYDKIQFSSVADESNFDTTDIAYVKYCLVNQGIKIDTIYSYDEYQKRNKDGSWDIIDQRNINDSVIKYVIKGGGKWGLVDLTGNELTPIKYDKMRYYFHEEMLPIKLNGKWGFINNLGKEVVPIIYDTEDQGYFNEGKAKVKLGERYFYIDKNGKELE